jgi:hypothetical protein
MAEYTAVAAVAIAMAGYEYVAWFLHIPRQPGTLAAFAVVITAYALLRRQRALRQLKLLELGRDGERAMGDVLETLKATGAVVLHDIVGVGFNIDHVVLCRKGIYAIETKTYRKPSSGEISYDGKALKIADEEPLSDAMAEIAALAAWLRRMIKELTGRSFRIRPVVVFPGWYVRNQGPAWAPEIWVLNPGQWAAIIDRQPVGRSKEDLRSAVYCLTRFIKTSARAALEPHNNEARPANAYALSRQSRRSPRHPSTPQAHQGSAYSGCSCRRRGGPPDPRRAARSDRPAPWPVSSR